MLVRPRAGATLRVVPAETPPEEPFLSLFPRFWLAFAAFFRIVFDGRFAARARDLGNAPRLAPASQPAAPATPAPPSALQLLSMLQREGRLVDFLQQDITAFPDAEVGAAARVVHDGCRRALRSHVRIEPVFVEREGARVELASGFDADEVKLVGDVRGQPPYAGVLRHRGWRATKLELPQVVGRHDASVLAPAEVELG